MYSFIGKHLQVSTSAEKMAGIPKNKERLGADLPSKEKSEENERADLMREEEEHEAKEVASSGAAGQSGPFVRNYRGKNSGGANAAGVGGNGAYRMSMTIRPQTVANLASKFDTIVKDQQPASKNSRQGGLKLRSYDITKIISELNKLNNEGGSADQSRVKSKPKPGKNENHLPCDGSSGGSSSGTVGDVRERRNLCGLGGDSSRHAKTTASQPEAAAALRPTLVKKTAEESHNNRGARQDAVGPVGSCRLPGGAGAGICENNLAPSGRNDRSRCTSEEAAAAGISSPSSLPTSSSTASSLPASSLASSSSRGRKESRKGLAVSFSPEQQVSNLVRSFLHTNNIEKVHLLRSLTKVTAKQRCLGCQGHLDPRVVGLSGMFRLSCGPSLACQGCLDSRYVSSSTTCPRPPHYYHNCRGEKKRLITFLTNIFPCSARGICLQFLGRHSFVRF